MFHKKRYLRLYDISTTVLVKQNSSINFNSSLFHFVNIESKPCNSQILCHIFLNIPCKPVSVTGEYKYDYLFSHDNEKLFHNYENWPQYCLEDVACVAGPYSSQIHTKSVCCAWVAPMLRRSWKDLIAAPVRTCRLRSSAPPAWTCCLPPLPLQRSQSHHTVISSQTLVSYTEDSFRPLSEAHDLIPLAMGKMMQCLPVPPTHVPGWKPPQRSRISPSLHLIGSC